MQEPNAKSLAAIAAEYRQNIHGLSTIHLLQHQEGNRASCSGLNKLSSRYLKYVDEDRFSLNCISLCDKDPHQLSTCESLKVLVVSLAYYKKLMMVVDGDLLPNYYQIATGAH
jgi:hypothetical protein